MNKKRRIQIEEAVSKINLALSLVQDVLDEESESYENMTEGLRRTENGIISEEAIENLETAIGALEDSVFYLEEI